MSPDNRDSAKPPRLVRDCLECQERDGMVLQNAARTPSVNIPLLYVCKECGTMLTIPPPRLPVV